MTSLTESQLAALKLLRQKTPIDLIPGYSEPTGDTSLEDKYPWLRQMRRWSLDEKMKASAYANQMPRKNRIKNGKRLYKKVLSSEGFPPWVTVTYLSMPGTSFTPVMDDRKVKYVTFHSFGHLWAANRIGIKGPASWMNSMASGKGLSLATYNGQTVYIPAGSDANGSNPANVSSTIQAFAISSSAKSVHFLIDRDGNLFVLGDCNDITYADGNLSKDSCSISLEEAFYLEDPTVAATWGPGGAPPGTEGTIKYFAYSVPQLLTLSIVCKKLETAFPDVASRTLAFTRKSVVSSSGGGYASNDWVSGSTGIDISPQFLDQSLWDAFFALVDSHTGINLTNVWNPVSAYLMDMEEPVSAPSSTEKTTGLTQLILKDSQYLGVAVSRASSEANKTRSDVNSDASKRALNDSRYYSQEAARLQSAVQQSESPPSGGPGEIPMENGKQVGTAKC